MNRRQTLKLLAGAAALAGSATALGRVAIAQAADRLGYHHLTASEHVAVPVDVEARRGQRYWDATATLAYFAAVTTRIRLATNMVVLPYHHPLEIAPPWRA